MGTEVLKQDDDNNFRSFSRKLWKRLILRKRVNIWEIQVIWNARKSSDIMWIIGSDSSRSQSI